MKMLDERKVT